MPLDFDESLRPEREESLLPQAIQLAPDLIAKTASGIRERLYRPDSIRGIEQCEGRWRYFGV
jgi:hypothetical protein